MPLDTRGFADGFMRGYQFVDNIEQRNKNNERVERLDKERADDRQWTRDRAENQDDLAAEDRQWNRDRTQRLDDSNEEFRGLQMESMKAQEGRAKKQDGRLDKAERLEDNNRMAQEIWALIDTGGMINDEQSAFLEKNPQYSPKNFMDTKFTESIDYFASAINDGIDDDELAYLNKPQSLDAMNRLLKDELNKGEGSNKRIKRIYPDESNPGQLFFELAVVGKDGKEYTAPATVGRDSNPEANLLPISIGDMTERLAGYNSINSAIREMTPEEKKNFLDFGVRQGWLKPTATSTKGYGKLNDNTLYNKDDGTTMSVGGSGGGGGAKTPFTEFGVASMGIMLEGSDEPISLVSMSTNRSTGGTVGYDEKGNRYVDNGNGWARAGQIKPQLGAPSSTETVADTASGNERKAAKNSSPPTEAIAELRANKDNPTYINSFKKHFGDPDKYLDDKQDKSKSEPRKRNDGTFMGDVALPIWDAAGEPAAEAIKESQRSTKEYDARMMYDHYAKKGGFIPSDAIESAWPYLSNQEKQKVLASMPASQRSKFEQLLAQR